jgi:large subunit ribosomal protein L23
MTELKNMGILDRWSKKKDEENLKNFDTKPATKAKTVKAKTKTVVAAAPSVKSEAPTKGSVLSYKVLLHPLVTEKAAMAASHNKYSFVVDRRANKVMIAQSVNETYGIMPIAVRTINVSGRQVRFGSHRGRRSDYKKRSLPCPRANLSLYTKAFKFIQI